MEKGAGVSDLPITKRRPFSYEEEQESTDWLFWLLLALEVGILLLVSWSVNIGVQT